MIPDSIVKKVVLKAPRERVWDAISDHNSFGAWFGAEIDGPFIAGEEAAGRIVPTMADPDVARQQESYRGMPWRVVIDRIEPMTLFSFRWHPYAVDPDYDYSDEPMTLVKFQLADADGGTLLTITESGFNQIPIVRRAEAMKANDSGWEHQAVLIGKYLMLETR